MAIVEQEAPPLAAGMRLSRAEFLRRWESHPEIRKAELIGGRVYMPSPVSRDHGTADEDLAIWVGNYRVQTPGTDSGTNSTILLLDDAPQSDRYLRILPECGGKSWDEGKYVAGPPELMGEVCLSSTSYDLNEKYDLYEAAGVQEYLAVLMYEQEIRWHQLVDGQFQILPPDADGIHRSRVFPGLWLDGPALLRRDMSAVLAKLQVGLTSPEHHAFVERLAERLSGRPAGETFTKTHIPVSILPPLPFDMLTKSSAPVLKMYGIEEHRHRFSVWAAARAAQRGFTSVENLRKALERSGVREFLSTCDPESLDVAAFETHHRTWCRQILQWLRKAEVKKVTFGRAAKLIAIYLKSVVVLAGKHESALGRVAHPPIDSILLSNAAQASSGRSEWARVRWTTLDEDDYYRLIDQLRAIVAPDEPFWGLERYWTVTDEQGV